MKGGEKFIGLIWKCYT